MQRLPTLFLSHGSPMHAIEPGEAAGAWKALAASIPRPRAVLIASAHWETSLPMLTGRDRLDTIHDFGGFPEELYRIRYDAPGAPGVARRAQALLRDAGYTAAIDGCRGIDHGAWVPLRWMYPNRDVPIVQVSVQPSLGTEHHLRLGEALAPLADEGVLVIGSGHVTHNLRDWMTSRGDPRVLDYVPQFAEWLNQRIANDDREAVLEYRERAPSGERAHPTEEHFLPLFVAWGAAGAGARATRVLASVDGGALSMDAYRFDQAAASH
ncbi:MAG TPA: class III extradiol ring-cleavage dioxygenase [Steroidobacteraceae bacterium]